MHDSGTYNSNAAHVAAGINHEDDDYDDDVEQFLNVIIIIFFLFVQKSRRRGSRGRGCQNVQRENEAQLFCFFYIRFVFLKFEKGQRG